MDKITPSHLNSVESTTNLSCHNVRRELSITETKPSSLRSIALEFIAKNIISVDSLEGFPSEIGLEIFNKCVDDKFTDFSNWAEQSRIISLFVEAYPDEFLNSCKFTIPKIISELDYQIPFLIRYVHKLDISGCSLGDEHDILPLLKTCKRLKSLSLANNMLTYKGLRAVFGVKTHENMKLIYLDISNNYSISYLGLIRYVSSLKSVQQILVSVKRSDLKEWNEKLFDVNFCVRKMAPENKQIFVNVHLPNRSTLRFYVLPNFF